MRGIRAFIDVEGRKRWTLFDSGARNTYVTPDVAETLLQWDLPNVQPTALGGKQHHVNRMCALLAKVENHWVQTHARIIEEIDADENGTPIDVLFGALAMQEWGIQLDLPNERLDLTHFPEEFVEF